MAKRKIKKSKANLKKKGALIATVAVTSVAIVGTSAMAFAFCGHMAQQSGKAGHWFQSTFGLEIVHQKDEESLVVVDSTCSEKGSKTWTCKICGDEVVEIIEKKPHSEVIFAGGVPSTCTQVGYTPGVKCDVCGEIILPQTETGLKPHTEVPLNAVAPTCTNPGLTAGSKCDVCGEVFVEQEEIPALGHNIEGTDCLRCDYVDLDAVFPAGYEYVAPPLGGSVEGAIYRICSIDYTEEFNSMTVIYTQHGETYQCWLSPTCLVDASGDVVDLGVKFFTYAGYHYVKFPVLSEEEYGEGRRLLLASINTSLTPKLVQAIEYDTEYALWNLPESNDYILENGVLTFNGTGIVSISTKTIYEDFELTFKVNEVSDIRGAFQLGIGASMPDAEIMSVPYVQFNYDRPVVVLPDGTAHNYWTNGQEWKVRVENGALTLSCESGVICENLAIDAAIGHIILRAESSCALSIHNLRIVKL